jgi:hypothetical protein
MITAKKLTIEINKAIPTYIANAHESINDGLASFVSMETSSASKVEEVKNRIRKHLNSLDYLDGKFDIISKVDHHQKPDTTGFYVFAWNNEDDFQKYTQAVLGLEMEALLSVKKLVIKQQEQMLATVKKIKAAKDNKEMIPCSRF